MWPPYPLRPTRDITTFAVAPGGALREVGRAGGLLASVNGLAARCGRLPGRSRSPPHRAIAPGTAP
jgi:hypothetical protein